MTGSTDRASTPVPPPADPAGDADGDGASNLVEFTAGTIPTSFASLSLPTLSLAADGSPRLSFSRRNESVGIRYRVETLENLHGWLSGFEIDGGGTAVTPQPMLLFSRSGGAVERIALELPLVTFPLGTKYFRLRVSR